MAYRSVKFRDHPNAPLLCIGYNVSDVFLGVDMGVVIGSLCRGKGNGCGHRFPI